MTREEAKKIRIDTVAEYSYNSTVYNIDEVNKRIDKIFDYFEKKQQKCKCGRKSKL